MSRLVAVFVPDLADAGAIQRAIEQAGGRAVAVTAPAALPPASEGAAAVVVDLDAEGVLDVLSHIATPSIGFLEVAGADAVDAALTAGCHQVLPRSALFRSLSEVLSAYLDR